MCSLYCKVSAQPPLENGSDLLIQVSTRVARLNSLKLFEPGSFCQKWAMEQSPEEMSLWQC